jgi:hypothetical protein
MYSFRPHFCTPNDALVVRYILSFTYKILSRFVKLPSDTLLRYFIIFHLAPSPLSLQLISISHSMTSIPLC